MRSLYRIKSLFCWILIEIIRSASRNFRLVAMPVARLALGDAQAPAYVNKLFLEYHEKFK